MLLVVSPAKTLNFQSELPEIKHSKARLLARSAELAEVMRQKEPWQLSELMHISNDLALLNANRYQQWRLPFSKKSARPAIYAFKGDVYTGLDVASLSEADLSFAQQHMRILSGLYGLLRPLDWMMPYRLEMGTRLQVGDCEDLYQFWGLELTQLVNKDLRKSSSKVLINLASHEYFRSLQTKHLKASVVTPVFKDRKGSDYKVVSFWAKKARGLMARFIIQNRLQQPSQLKDFDTAGYCYSREYSTSEEMVFLRDLPA